MPCKNSDLRVYGVNDDFFKEWSHDMAYILGFWFADGCIYKREFHISQHEKDHALINKMASVMKSTYKISKSNSSNNLILWVTSEKIVSDIKKLGGKENKSLTCDFPEVPKKYLPDFTRGFFDGDGSISARSYRKNRFEASITCGSEKFAKKLFKKLKEIAKGIPWRLEDEPGGFKETDR